MTLEHISFACEWLLVLQQKICGYQFVGTTKIVCSDRVVLSHGYSKYLETKKLWVLRSVVFKNKGTQLWVFKICGTQKLWVLKVLYQTLWVPN